jgi:hypothetical protein
VAAWCVGGAPPALDEDDDGLNDLQEAFFGTDPHKADTDGNGIQDGDEDFDQDGIVNKDEPTIFSLEGFVDPFAAGARRFALVIEGTNLVNLFTPTISNRINFLDTRQTVRMQARKRLNRGVRLYLLTTRTRAKKLVGQLQVDTPLGDTNRLVFQRTLCPLRLPALMAAALIRVKTRLNGKNYRLTYVTIGGCNLIDKAPNRRASTTVRLPDHDIAIKVPYGGIATMPSRIMLPAHSFTKGDPAYPYADNFEVGTVVRIVTKAGISNAVQVQPSIAELRIPPDDLREDHDGDGIPSDTELTIGTDPLTYDTDHDHLADGDELARSTDPLDPDTNGDGILDGDQ